MAQDMWEIYTKHKQAAWKLYHLRIIPKTWLNPRSEFEEFLTDKIFGKAVESVEWWRCLTNNESFQHYRFTHGFYSIPTFRNLCKSFTPYIIYIELRLSRLMVVRFRLKLWASIKTLWSHPKSFVGYSKKLNSISAVVYAVEDCTLHVQTTKHHFYSQYTSARWLIG